MGVAGAQFSPKIFCTNGKFSHGSGCTFGTKGPRNVPDQLSSSRVWKNRWMFYDMFTGVFVSGLLYAMTLLVGLRERI